MKHEIPDRLQQNNYKAYEGLGYPHKDGFKTGQQTRSMN